MAQWVKNLPAMQETQVRMGRSSGKGNGNPPLYSCLGNPMDRGALWVTVHGVPKSWLKSNSSLFYSVVQSLSHSDSLRPHGLQHARFPCPSPSPGACSNSCPLTVMPSNHLILCHLLLLLPSIFPSIRVFSNELALRIRWPKCWGFSFSISPSKEYSGSISFRIDYFCKIH